MSDLLIIPFGKYKGKSILEMLCDKRYVEWFMENKDLNLKYIDIFSIIKSSLISEESIQMKNYYIEIENQANLISYFYKKH